MRTSWVIGGMSAAAIMAAAFGWSAAHQSQRVVVAPPIVRSALAPADLRGSRPTLAPIDAMAFVDRRTVNQSVTSTRISGTPIAGVVNHHVLASDTLARFWASVAQARPHLTRIIILSPDHFFQGSHPMSVHERSYQTDEGLVYIDVTSTRALRQSDMVGEEDGVMFEREHGVGALVPFIHHACPQAQIVPIAIRGTMDVGRVAEIGALLRSIIDEQTFVVVSSDMSHYLTAQTALANDIETEQWMKARDEAAMKKATDTHTDNGIAFAMLFEALQNEPVSFTRIDHKISSDYDHHPEFTTSYLTGVWTRTH